MFTLKTVAVADADCPKIADVMTKNVVTVSASESIAEAEFKMNRKNLVRVPVVDNCNFPIGMISKQDIQKKEAELKEFDSTLSGSCKVEKLMSKPAVTIFESKNVADAYNKMTDSKVNSLIVTDNSGRISGIITKNDINKLQSESNLRSDIKSVINCSDELLDKIIEDFDEADAIALAIFKSLK